jgi:NAD(P)-dependent dehydrogenase (short-subunit alcohol dehydrogenase family)
MIAVGVHICREAARHGEFRNPASSHPPVNPKLAQLCGRCVVLVWRFGEGPRGTLLVSAGGRYALVLTFSAVTCPGQPLGRAIKALGLAPSVCQLRAECPYLLGYRSLLAQRMPRPASLPYTASKAALSAYSKGLAVEVGRHGVRVNCVLPGFIPSEDHAERLNDRAEAAGMPTEQFLQQIVNAIPLGRPGTPQEAAQLIAYFVSPAASYLSGAQILFDGAAFPTL